MNLININKHGRTFSIVNIPYAFKLLMQELQAMNVQMRIITEDNVDQLMSLTKGDDIEKLILLTKKGLSGVIIGKAIYESRIKIKDLIMLESRI